MTDKGLAWAHNQKLTFLDSNGNPAWTTGYGPELVPPPGPALSTLSGTLGSHRLTICHEPNGWGTLAAAYTQHVVWEVPDDVDYVQLIVGNSANSTFTNDRAAVAPTSQVGVAPNVYDGTGSVNTTLWTPAYTDNNGTDAAPIPYRTPNNRSLAVPANAGATPASVPTFSFYDPAPIKTIPRLDKNNGTRLIASRIYSAAGPMQVTNLAEPSVTGISSLLGISYAEFSIAGDAVTTPTLTTGGSYGYVAPAILRCWTRKPGATLLAIGDSTIEGFNTSSGVVNAFNRAAAFISQPGIIPVTCASLGWSGQTANQYGQRGLAHISALKPQVVCWLTATQNDPFTQAAMDNAWNLVMAAAQLCKDLGIIFIPVTPTPWPGATTATIENQRLTAVQRSFQTFKLVLDYNAILGNNGFPAALAPQFNSGDNIHPNDAGHIAAGLGIGAPKGTTPLLTLLHTALGI